MTTGSIVPPPYPIPGVPAEAPVPPVPRPPVPIFGPPTRFMTAWPRDIRSKMTQGALLGGVGAGLAAALCWRSSLPGLGWTLTAFAVALAAFATQKVQWTPTRIGALVLALCLAVVPTVRDAEWLVALCVLTSLALFVYALAPARTWTGLVYGQFVMLRTPFRVAGWMRRGRRAMSRGHKINPDRVAIVVLVTVGLVAAFGALLADADARFSALISGVLPFVSFGDVVGRVIVGVLVGGFALAAIYVLSKPPSFDRLAPTEPKKLPRWEWSLPLAALNLLFIAFVGVQISVLFGGDEHVQVTEGLTYAEYARQGFWQLLFVTILVMGVIAVAIRVAGREDARDRLFLRALIGGLCVTTLVIVASAIHRMSLYEKAYGFSVERLLVRWIELGMAIVLVLILVAGIRMSARWLPTAVVAVGSFGMLGLAIFNPESYIAQRNVEFFQQTGKIDQWYMGGLSSDAFAATKSLPEDVLVCVQGRMKDRLRPTAPWYEYNVSRAHLRAAEAKETSCNMDYDHR
ncbi:DUF4153 domain-containing protein [Mycobacteroides chelonae]|uniref:DUF4153 domain-containing protein n=1 Tax=Mycobacteroides chelonae TaxID=1774 RepID=UPI0004AB6DAF|nr:DUF4173 domain-containing protein [Mycobacteroides chelonae]MBF9316382.1 DUF4173 domain-containing protein [Mycobacteroides chelonae]OHT67742.1 beta-carotene 15,15'-monooxygenase [Mycobacteroides chelonae]OHT69384.1 beta-carotene 15,15'-monooxygenase [Mycobacteroides chelonae]OHT84302.1 beta-carotene 15,15'-monooxygenase [Mycobacteroides chelonae]